MTGRRALLGGLVVLISWAGLPTFAWAALTYVGGPRVATSKGEGQDQEGPVQTSPSQQGPPEQVD
ncbi:MAG: hypothetical protein EOO60_02980, partial [Hymenobacter sp.]